MSAPISLVIDPSSFTRNSSGNVIGVIYVGYGPGGFPACGWSDFVLPVCTAWLEAISSLSTKLVSSNAVYFMDGPYRVDLTTTFNGQIELKFIEDRHHMQSVHTVLVADPTDVMRSAVSAAGLALDECMLRGWEGRDVNSLRKAYASGQSMRMKGNSN